MIWLTEADVVASMDMRAAVRALEIGLRAEARGAATNLTKTHAAWTVPPSEARSSGGAAASGEPAGQHATLHAIGAVFPEYGFAGTKTWAHTPGGATPLVVLYDALTGELLAIIEAFAMGQLRTGAASGIATQMMAAADADELALIGTGRQALAQAAAVHAVRPLRRVRVFGRDVGRRQRMADRVRGELGIDAVEAESVADAVRDAPIVTTVTRARQPFLCASMLGRGVHINAVGAIVPGAAEIGPDVVARCSRIVADSPEQARRLSRELVDVMGADEAAWGRVDRLADVVASGGGRRAGDDLTLFKSLGMGISDLSLAIEIYRDAIRSGRGRELPNPKRAEPRLAVPTAR